MRKKLYKPLKVLNRMSKPQTATHRYMIHRLGSKLSHPLENFSHVPGLKNISARKPTSEESNVSSQSICHKIKIVQGDDENNFQHLVIVPSEDVPTESFINRPNNISDVGESSLTCMINQESFSLLSQLDEPLINFSHSGSDQNEGKQHENSTISKEKMKLFHFLSQKKKKQIEDEAHIASYRKNIGYKDIESKWHGEDTENIRDHFKNTLLYDSIWEKESAQLMQTTYSPLFKETQSYIGDDFELSQLEFLESLETTHLTETDASEIVNENQLNSTVKIEPAQCLTSIIAPFLSAGMGMEGLQQTDLQATSLQIHSEMAKLPNVHRSLEIEDQFEIEKQIV